METLKKRADFQRLRQARKSVRPGVVVQMAPQPSEAGSGEAGRKGPLRVGYTVTRRVGNAVVRNRVKRRLRAAAAQVLQAIGRPGYDYVLIGRQATIGRSYECLLDDLEGALIKLHTSKRKKRDA